jgi:hypothetical protein
LLILRFRRSISRSGRLQHQIRRFFADHTASAASRRRSTIERGLSILWIEAICGSVQNSMLPPEKNVVRRVGKLTLYEPG